MAGRWVNGQFVNDSNGGQAYQMPSGYSAPKDYYDFSGGGSGANQKNAKAEEFAEQFSKHAQGIVQKKIDFMMENTKKVGQFGDEDHRDEMFKKWNAQGSRLAEDMSKLMEKINKELESELKERVEFHQKMRTVFGDSLVGNIVGLFAPGAPFGRAMPEGMQNWGPSRGGRGGQSGGQGGGPGMQQGQGGVNGGWWMGGYPGVNYPYGIPPGLQQGGFGKTVSALDVFNQSLKIAGEVVKTFTRLYRSETEQMSAYMRNSPEEAKMAQLQASKEVTAKMVNWIPLIGDGLANVLTSGIDRRMAETERLQAFDKGSRQRIGELSEVNGPMARIAALQEINKMKLDMEEAKRLGPQYERIGEVQMELDQARRELSIAQNEKNLNDNLKLLTDQIKELRQQKFDLGLTNVEKGLANLGDKWGFDLRQNFKSNEQKQKEFQELIQNIWGEVKRKLFPQESGNKLEEAFKKLTPNWDSLWGNGGRADAAPSINYPMG